MVKIMNAPDLLAPVRLGAIEAPNRLVMAPLTRMRAGPGRVPTPLMAEYYAQRAAAGLIVSEATAISQQSTGCPNTPGVYTDEQLVGIHRLSSNGSSTRRKMIGIQMTVPEAVAVRPGEGGTNSVRREVSARFIESQKMKDRLC